MVERQESRAGTSSPAPPREVTATALGPWPGEDPVEAARIIRGELGSPHLPFLAELPDRGVGSDALGRTASLLAELAVDVQPYGWRLVDRPGKDFRRAASALATDINVLADVAGAEENPATEIKVQLVGPLSLAAGLHLHNGERALLDYGARRDLAASLAAGVGGFLSRVAALAAAGATGRHPGFHPGYTLGRACRLLAIAGHGRAGQAHPACRRA